MLRSAFDMDSGHLFRYIFIQISNPRRCYTISSSTIPISAPVNFPASLSSLLLRAVWRGEPTRAAATSKRVKVSENRCQMSVTERGCIDAGIRHLRKKGMLVVTAMCKKSLGTEFPQCFGSPLSLFPRSLLQSLHGRVVSSVAFPAARPSDLTCIS